MLDFHNQQQINRVAGNWRLTPATFASKISGGAWIPAPHLRLISLKIAQAVAQGHGRIIISLPPRHGKSELVSVYTPAWLLENWPKKRIILASYGSDLSVGFGRRVRDLFEEKEAQELLHTRLDRNSKKVSMFHTQQGGYMASVGVGGPITGRGADVLLIDDYIKEVKEALSLTYREYIWNWFATTAFTRLEPGGTCIIIATRWHTDDLIGRILANKKGWDYIEIPAIAQVNDPMGREIGEPLFPERYSLQDLEESRDTLGSIWFNALYQQKPMDESQKIADSRWFLKEAALPNKPLRMARVWDLAATQDGGDYTTGTKSAYDLREDMTYIADVRRGQISAEKTESLVKKTALEDGPSVIIGIEVEPGSAGKHLFEHFKNNVLPGYNVKPITTGNKGSKVVRAQPFLAAAEAGKVTMLVAPWNGAFDKEFDSFPGGLNDDQVDTAAAAYSLLTGKKVFSVTFGRKKAQENFNSKRIRRSQFSMAEPSTPFERDRYGKIIPTKAHAKDLVRGATFGRSK